MMDRRRRVWFWTVLGFLVLFCVGSTKADVSGDTLPPPSDVIINQTNLTWNSTARDVAFTVQYRDFNSEWRSVESCRNTRIPSCGFGWEQSRYDYGCLRLRVAARTNRSRSEFVEACSSGGYFCTPRFTLTAAAGSLTVILNRNHSLVDEHGENLKHRVYCGKKGEELNHHEDSLSSLLIKDLDVGQEYCVTTAFVLHGDLLGPASCVRCVTIPPFTGSERTQIIVISVLAASIIVLFVAFTYTWLFKFKKIKKILQPPFTIPETFREPCPERLYPFMVLSPFEERYDNVIAVEPRGNEAVRNSVTSC